MAVAWFPDSASVVRQSVARIELRGAFGIGHGRLQTTREEVGQ
jgi:hypothetical protein